MIIFPNAVWIHVPKTAGSSFEIMCEKRHNIPITGEQHDTARDIPQQHRDKWIFGFIREPMNAEVSNWRYHRASWDNNGNFTFENWCIWRYGGEEAAWAAKQMGLKPHPVEYGHVFNVRPQAGYFCNEDGKCIADRIFRYEELYDSLTEVEEKLGMNVRIGDYQGMQYGWSRGREQYAQHVTPICQELLRKAKGIDYMLHSLPGSVNVNYICETVPKYAYSR